MDRGELERAFDALRVSGQYEQLLSGAKQAEALRSALDSSVGGLMAASERAFQQYQSLFHDPWWTNSATTRLLDQLSNDSAVKAMESLRIYDDADQRAIESIAEQTRIPDGILAALEPINPNVLSVLQTTYAEMERSTRAAFDFGAIDRAFEAMRTSFDLIGEWEITRDQEEDHEADEQPEVLVPDEIRERITRVEFLPLRVIDAIRTNNEEMRSLSPRDFERFIAELISGLGFVNVRLTGATRDGGRDVIASQHVGGIPVLYTFECKRYSPANKIGVDMVRGLLGSVTSRDTEANIGVLVTTSTFTSDARKLILSECRLDGKDFNAVVEWLEQYRA
jgi:Holliday junction resolvase